LASLRCASRLFEIFLSVFLKFLRNLKFFALKIFSVENDRGDDQQIVIFNVVMVTK
jgi:hypothetical protein